MIKFISFKYNLAPLSLLDNLSQDKEAWSPNIIFKIIFKFRFEFFEFLAFLYSSSTVSNKGINVSATNLPPNFPNLPFLSGNIL